MRKSEGRARLTDVARLAGCAPVTVSRFFNDPGRVSDDVKRAIEGAIGELGYYRNESARVLRSKRSKLVGVVIPTLRHSIYADMVEGLQRLEAMVADLEASAAADTVPTLDVIAAVTLFDYQQFRHGGQPWLPETPGLRALAQRLNGRPSFQRSRPR